MLVLTLLLGNSLRAQTNLGFVTITNRAGEATSVEALSTDGMTVSYRYTNGSGGGRVKMTSLSTNDQWRLGYNPDFVQFINQEDPEEATRARWAQKRIEIAHVPRLITVLDGGWKVIESNKATAKFSYRFWMHNSSDQGITTDMTVKFFDSAGYLLHRQTDYGIYVPSHRSATNAEFAFINQPLASQVFKISISVDAR